MLFFWEIGGQNIPNDWGDIEEDRRMNAQTIPVCWGLRRSNVIILLTIILTLGMNAVIFYFTRTRFEFGFVVLALIVGCYLLLFPAIKLSQIKDREYAMTLFNKASYYPLALLAVVVIKLLIS
jgi:4-hydroxybenzoate polyprenyltransferase